LQPLIVIVSIIGETGTKLRGKVLVRLICASGCGAAQRTASDLSRSFAPFRLPENTLRGTGWLAELPLLLETLGAQFAVVENFAAGNADVADHLQDMAAGGRGRERDREYGGNRRRDADHGR
jgi:hypothetical protein